MNKNEFRPLLDEGESQDLEWKTAWPPGLLGGKTDPAWDEGRGELLKDLIASVQRNSDRKNYFTRMQRSRARFKYS
jgi:hypothetical protein